MREANLELLFYCFKHSQQLLFYVEACHERKTVKKVPKGTSDYQSAWIIDDEDNHDDSEDNGSVEDMLQDDIMEEIKDESGHSAVSRLRGETF